MKKLFVAILICASMVAARAQETELFASTQSGDPFKNNLESERILWNYSFGVEQYFIDKLSLSLSYRKPFFLISDDVGYASSEYDYFEIVYRTNYNMYAIDLESKYFFEDPEEGWYLSSGLSYQHIETSMDVTSIYDQSGNYRASPFPLGTYKEEKSIFPFSLKAGHRNSGDVLVFDYYFGFAYNLGSGDVAHQYSDYLQYDSFKSLSIILGLKMGFKI
jgi:hypothetical protein